MPAVLGVVLLLLLHKQIAEIAEKILFKIIHNLFFVNEIIKYIFRWMSVCASQNTFFAQHYITSLSEFIIKQLQCIAITSKLLGVHSIYMKLQILPSSLIAVEKTNF